MFLKIVFESARAIGNIKIKKRLIEIPSSNKLLIEDPNSNGFLVANPNPNGFPLNLLFITMHARITVY